MKITSTKRDDILREKEEYEAQYEENERKREAEHSEFRDAEHAVLDPIKEKLESMLSSYNVLTFDVRVDRNWHYGVNRGVEVDIKCNDRDHFAENSALSWNFNVRLSQEGEVLKETGSWSGLKATTPAQLKSLRQSVMALEDLNDMDWASVIDVDMPKFEDYLKTPMLKNRSSEFNSRLQQAELEELVGTNKCVLVQNFESSGYRGRSIYVRLIRETPSQYVVNVMGDWELDRYRNGDSALDDRYTQRVKKSNIVPVIRDGNMVIEEI